MLKIVNVGIRNFMSFGDELQIVELEDCGLLLLEGQNMKSSSASSNGSGKTNILEAIVWCLYGRTTKNVPVADVVNNTTKKNCFVAVLLHDDKTDDHYEIKRYRKDDDGSNGLSFIRAAKGTGRFRDGYDDLSGVDAKDTQFKINAFLGMSFELFCTSTYFSQANIKPFSLFTDSEIKKTFMESMDLTRFSDALIKARESVRSENTKIDIFEDKLSAVKRDVLSAIERIKGYKEADFEFEARKKAAIDELTARINDLEDESALAFKIKTDLEKCQKAEQALKEELSAYPDLKKEQTTQDDDLRNFSNKQIALRTKLASLGFDISKLVAQAENISLKIGTDCSECGKIISKKDLADISKATDDKIAILKNEERKMAGINEKAELVGNPDGHFKIPHCGHPKIPHL